MYDGIKVILQELRWLSASRVKCWSADLAVPRSISGGGNLFNCKWCFIAHSLSLSYYDWNTVGKAVKLQVIYPSTYLGYSPVNRVASSPKDDT